MTDVKKWLADWFYGVRTWGLIGDETNEEFCLRQAEDALNELLRENTVLETKVMLDSDGDGIEYPCEEWLTLEDSEIPIISENIGLKDGDNVKLIIVKTNE
jgi:hypothetical protein